MVDSFVVLKRIDGGGRSLKHKPKIFEICCLAFASFVRAKGSLERFFVFANSHRSHHP
jgi:hypothetical protein